MSSSKRQGFVCFEISLLESKQPFVTYKELIISWHDMIESWDNDFIPPEIAIHATNSDHHEREGYTVGLQTGNYFDAADDAVLSMRVSMENAKTT
jgi:hypothetical protein